MFNWDRISQRSVNLNDKRGGIDINNQESLDQDLKDKTPRIYGLQKCPLRSQKAQNIQTKVSHNEEIVIQYIDIKSQMLNMKEIGWHLN